MDQPLLSMDPMLFKVSLILLLKAEKTIMAKHFQGKQASNMEQEVRGQQMEA